MRALLILLVLATGTVAPAAAVTLQTAAEVTLVAPATARLDHWTAADEPAWKVTGAPDQQLQLSLELQTAGGRRIALARGAALTLDADGAALTRLAAPPVSPHDPVDVVTLVICRE